MGPHLPKKRRGGKATVRAAIKLPSISEAEQPVACSDKADDGAELPSLEYDVRFTLRTGSKVERLRREISERVVTTWAA